MQKIEISAKTIIFTVVFIILLNFLWNIRDLIFSLFIAFIIMSALKPMVTFLVSKRIPKIIASILTYALFIGFLIVLFVIIIPPLVKESTMLFRSLPLIIQNLSAGSFFDFEILSQYVPNLTSQVFDLAKIVFSNAIFTISTLFFGFYFILDENLIESTLLRFFEKEKTAYIKNLFKKIERRMSSWFWGEVVLMTIVGSMTFVGLSLIGIRYALPLAVLAGLMEAIPNLGPTLSSIPSILIGMSQSYFLGFAALALAFLVQQLENNIIVPMVMKKAVGLNPIVTLIVLLIGGRMAGILGVVLAIPTTLFIETVLIEIIKSRNSTVNLR